MKNTAALVLLLLVSALVPACAHVDAITKDVESCAAQDKGQFVFDLEKSAVPFVENVIMCDPDFSAAALPACVESSLADVGAAIGPDGKRFIACVVTTIENDPNALAKQRERAKATRLMLARRDAANASTSPPVFGVSQ